NEEEELCEGASELRGIAKLEHAQKLDFHAFLAHHVMHRLHLWHHQESFESGNNGNTSTVWLHGDDTLISSKRSKTTIKDVSGVWGDDVNNLWWSRLIPNPTANKITASELVLKEGLDEIGCRDRRYPGGLRIVLPFEKKKPPLPSHFTQLSPEEYTIRRILHGVPEGIIDFPSGEALPLQSNFDYMDGIDFRKGCYLGQELTFRTYHTDVTRKRILSVQFYASNDARPDRLSIDRTIENLNVHPGSVIYSSKDTKRKELGKIRVTRCNVGLSLFRLTADLIVMGGDNKKLRNMTLVSPFLLEVYEREQELYSSDWYRHACKFAKDWVTSDKSPLILEMFKGSITGLRQRILDHNLASDAELKQIEKDARSYIEEAKQKALKDDFPSSSELFTD
ncbi:4347_t:CDS:2, partial [Paraglomus occultum]